MIWGLGSESVLRAKFYLGTRTTPDGKQDDILKGVLDLVDWWQQFALAKASIALADSKQTMVNRLTASEMDCRTFCQRVKNHAASLDDQQRIAVVAKTDELLAVFQQNGGKSLTPDQQRDLNRELCYGLLKLVGKRGLNLLIRRD